MYDDETAQRLGRKNGWPCIDGSLWEEPLLCLSYGCSGCPCASGEDRPCSCGEDGLFMDMLPFVMFS